MKKSAVCDERYPDKCPYPTMDIEDQCARCMEDRVKYLENGLEKMMNLSAGTHSTIFKTRARLLLCGPPPPGERREP